MKTSIAIVGFMGAGKTAVGMALAQKVGLKYVSTDKRIEQKCGLTIPALFEKEGEIRFRELEITTVEEIAPENYALIDCGGGVVLNTINIARLKQNAVIVYLSAKPADLIKRLSADMAVRPVLMSKSISEIKKLIAFRDPFYKYAADLRINTSGLDIDTIVKKTIKELKKHEDFSFKK